jgi:RNA polymerase sigma factor (sigma-70 family)
MVRSRMAIRLRIEKGVATSRSFGRLSVRRRDNFCKRASFTGPSLISALLSNFFAIPGPFLFWKEVKTNPFDPNGEPWKQKGAIITLDILSDTDENLGSAVQSGFKRIRSWRVPPNWSRGAWFEELTAVGTAAAWQAVCDFDPERGVPLAGFGYCRMMTRCLSRYRKEWRYALHVGPSDSCEEESTAFKHPRLTGSSAANGNGTHPSNDDLRRAVSSLPAEQRRLIEQLFWEERTETEVADATGTNQSTVNRCKRAILNGLRRKLRDCNEFQKRFLHKDSVRCSLTN